MCGICGCSDPVNIVTIKDVSTGKSRVLREGGLLEKKDAHTHSDNHHSHAGDDLPHIHGPNGETISLEQAVLSKNDEIAARNRGWFEGRRVLALNLVSSPGSGKTSLLEYTIRNFSKDYPISVIEGDQMTENDAERVRKAGAKAVQINTGATCHLEADMIAEAVKSLSLDPGTILMIENVGNLVCPSMFDLGEHMKIAVISVTEGEDKPLKYPHMFRASDCVVINKIDIAEAVKFDGELCRHNIKEINPAARIISLSANTGEGMEEWFNFLTEQCRQLN